MDHEKAESDPQIGAAMSVQVKKTQTGGGGNV